MTYAPTIQLVRGDDAGSQVFTADNAGGPIESCSVTPALPAGLVLDTGTCESLLDASSFVATLEKRQGLKVSVPEEIAWREGWISDQALLGSADAHGRGTYGAYLRTLLHRRVI